MENLFVSNVITTLIGTNEVTVVAVSKEGAVVDSGMNTEEGAYVDPGMATAVKDPLLASWPFVIGVSSAVLFVSVVLGILLAKRKIKKGIELYED